MAFGIATWDANGVYNNYGIKPVSVVGEIPLASNQTSGSWAFTIPAGFKVGFVVGLESRYLANYGPGRHIEASGNTITVSPANTAGLGNYPANECRLIVFMEKA